MSEAIKPTPGEWLYGHREGADGMWRTEVFSGDGEVIATLSWYPKPTNDGWIGTYREANARLIAEAGTVFHETQCTPRQLADRVKEMEEVVRALVAYDEAEHEDGLLMMLRYGAMLDDARAALSKSLPNTVAEVK